MNNSEVIKLELSSQRTVWITISCSSRCILSIFFMLRLRYELSLKYLIPHRLTQVSAENYSDYFGVTRKKFLFRITPITLFQYYRSRILTSRTSFFVLLPKFKSWAKNFLSYRGIEVLRMRTVSEYLIFLPISK